MKKKSLISSEIGCSVCVSLFYVIYTCSTGSRVTDIGAFDRCVPLVTIPGVQSFITLFVCVFVCVCVTHSHSLTLTHTHTHTHTHARTHYEGLGQNSITVPIRAFLVNFKDAFVPCVYFFVFCNRHYNKILDNNH